MSQAAVREEYLSPFFNPAQAKRLLERYGFSGPDEVKDAVSHLDVSKKAAL